MPDPVSLLNAVLEGRYAILVVAALACGGDSVGPIGVSFPTIAASDLSANCVRGTAVPPQVLVGDISVTDCATGGSLVGAGSDGHYDGWRVRVDVATSVTFSVISAFDSYLDLFQIGNLASPSLDNLLEFDDDSGVDLGASLTFSLQPGAEYWIMISGFDDTDIGSYGVAVTAN